MQRISLTWEKIDKKKSIINLVGQIDFTQSSFIEEMTVVAFQAWIAERKTHHLDYQK
jgi:hypothetical protein